MRTWASVGLIAFLGVTLAVGADTQRAVQGLQKACPQAQVYSQGDRITRVYGTIFGTGDSPETAADQFVLTHCELFGVGVDDLVPGNNFNGQYTQPVMWEPDSASYKFTLVYYRQVKNGIPVYGADLRLLVRNDPQYPLVLAASSLRDLGGFQAPAGISQSAAEAAATSAALVFEPSLTSFEGFELVIWAGIDDMQVTPRTAVTFIGAGVNAATQPKKFRFVADAYSGKLLYTENLIHFTDVTGTVRGMATTGPKADYCADEVATAMPYAQVSVTGGNSAYADVNGNFTIPNSGTTQVTVTSPMTGHYFTVDNVAGTEETLTLNVTPPLPANFMHNQLNTDTLVRAQINGYVQANIVRDFTLVQNPTYPTISTQTGFPVNVNRTDGYCPGNAWYDGTSLNLCQASSPYPNTAYSNVIHHEYGHHLVAMGGSGQGAYGEGMGDCIGMLIADDPILGYGFTGDCNTGIRTADNTFQYPCSGEIHECGQLLSGCVWATRQAMGAAYPSTALSLIRSLTVNSILLHTGTEVTPQITIDFLTTDDDDGNINNGTPHRTEICAGFGAHNMTCPALQVGLSVSPTAGFTSEGQVGGPFLPASKNYTVQNLGPGAISYSVTNAQPWITLTGASGTLPNVGDTAIVTVSINSQANTLNSGLHADTVNFVNTTNHQGDTNRAVELSVGYTTVYEWNMDTNPGWSVQGQWAWGHPTGGGGEYGSPDPSNGHTGTNVYGYNLAGDYASSIPEYHLTTTAIDCTTLTDTKLRFWRWLGVEQPSYDHAYVRVSNNGSTWTTVWENTAEVADSSWVFQEFNISAVADGQPTVYVRWTMGTTDGSWIYCGWNVDDVSIYAAGGEPPAITIHLPDGAPEVLTPGVATGFDVEITDGDETYVPGSGLLHYRYEGGTYGTLPLASLGGNLYQATLPAAGCGADPEFYVSAQGSGGTTVFSPTDAPGNAYTAVVGTLTLIIHDNFENDLGWTTAIVGATSGQWQRGVPVNDSSWDYDPVSDSDGSGKCFLTQNEMGNTDVDNGSVQLISPVLNMMGGGITISYDYYLYLTDTSGSVDMLKVEISNNGGAGNWIEIARHVSNGGVSWRHNVITQAALDAAGVTLTATMKLRFTANDADPQSINESGLDAFDVQGFVCNVVTGACCLSTGSCGEMTPTGCAGVGGTYHGNGTDCTPNPCAPTVCRGDSNCDDGINWRDIDYFVAAMSGEVSWQNMFLPGTPSCSYDNNDVNNDGTVNWRDIDPLVALMNTVCP